MISKIGPYVFNSFSIENIELPSSVVAFNHGAFAFSQSLRSLTAGSITRFENETFAYSSSIQNIVINSSTILSQKVLNFSGSSINFIGRQVFLNVEILHIYFPSSFSDLSEASLFAGFDSLETIEFEFDLKSIPASMFSYCSNLTKIISKSAAILENGQLLDSISSVGDSSFSGVQIRNVSIPSTSHFNISAFSDCSSLEFLVIESDNPDYVQIIFQHIGNLLDFSLNSVQILSNQKVDLRPFSIKSIPDFGFAFSNYSEIYLPKSIESIGSYAFRDSLSLKIIKIESSIRSISASTFLNLPEIESVKIGGKVVFDGNLLDLSDFEKVEPNSFANFGKIDRVVISGNDQKLYWNSLGNNQYLTSIKFNGAISSNSIDRPFINSTNLKCVEFDFDCKLGAEFFGNIFEGTNLVNSSFCDIGCEIEESSTSIFHKAWFIGLYWVLFAAIITASVLLLYFSSKRKGSLPPEVSQLPETQSNQSLI